MQGLRCLGSRRPGVVIRGVVVCTVMGGVAIVLEIMGSLSVPQITIVLLFVLYFRQVLLELLECMFQKIKPVVLQG